MNCSRNCIYAKTWAHNLLSLQAVSAVLSSFGALWLAVEITAFFFANTKAPEIIRSLWWLFGGVGVLVAVMLRRPRLSVAQRLNGRDVTLEIAIGNVFSFPGALIVGTNTTFDTRISRELISEHSVQGAFTKRYYGDEAQLDAELSLGLSGLQSQPLTGQRPGKSCRYPMGTAVRLNLKERTAYFLAIADLNEHGVASASFDGLKDCLAKLWVFIGSRGLKEPLVIPVLGTGFCRLSQTREEVVREIVKSFVAACSEKTLSEKLTIVLTPHDVSKYRISLEELVAFLRHVCSYTDFAQGQRQAVGTPV